MPLAKRWSVFDLDNMGREADTYGCYELGDSNGNIVYIGHGRIRQRLMVHWRDTENKPRISFYRCTYCGSKERAIQMERVELQQYAYLYEELPRYNKVGWINP